MLFYVYFVMLLLLLLFYSTIFKNIKSHHHHTTTQSIHPTPSPQQPPSSLTKSSYVVHPSVVTALPNEQTQTRAANALKFKKQIKQNNGLPHFSFFFFFGGLFFIHPNALSCIKPNYISLTDQLGDTTERERGFCSCCILSLITSQSQS